jgi:choline monooxygenase
MARFFVDSDISVAKTIHTDVYNSIEVFEESKESIFSKALHFIGDVDQFPESGFSIPKIISEGLLNEPIVLVKDKQDDIKCYSNVCTHRGNLIVTKPGKTGQLRCGYHGRTFGLDGQMKFMPEFEGVQDFPCASDHLTQLPVFQWGKLLFTSLDTKIDPLMYMDDMIKRMSFFSIDDLQARPEFNKEYLVDANWALYCENYLEGFHIPFVHKGLAEVLDYEDYETEIFYPYSNLQLGISKTNENCFTLTETSPDYGRNVAAYYFWVFPNMMFNFYPWGLSINIVQPLAKNKTKVNFITYVLDESLREKGAGAALDRVEAEDEAIVHNVQKGVRSRFYNHGRYSVKREKCTHHFHRLLAEFLK